jgi:hypothetical protein
MQSISSLFLRLISPALKGGALRRYPVIPLRVREQVGVRVGDLLEAHADKGKICVHA